MAQQLVQPVTMNNARSQPNTLQNFNETVANFINTKSISDQMVHKLYDTLCDVFVNGEIDQVRGIIKSLGGDNVIIKDYFIIKPKEQQTMQQTFPYDTQMKYNQFIEAIEKSKQNDVAIAISWLIYNYKQISDKFHVLPIIALLKNGQIKYVSAYDSNTDSMFISSIYIYTYLH